VGGQWLLWFLGRGHATLEIEKGRRLALLPDATDTQAKWIPVSSIKEERDRKKQERGKEREQGGEGAQTDRGRWEKEEGGKASVSILGGENKQNQEKTSFEETGGRRREKVKKSKT